jgi:hypothetical protein
MAVFPPSAASSPLKNIVLQRHVADPVTCLPFWGGAAHDLGSKGLVLASKPTGCLNCAASLLSFLGAMPDLGLEARLRTPN